MHKYYIISLIISLVIFLLLLLSNRFSISESLIMSICLPILAFFITETIISLFKFK